MIKIKVNDKEFQFAKKVKLEDLSKEIPGTFYAAKVNNRLRELTYYVSNDAEVEFLDLNNYDAMRTYEASLRYLIVMAFSNIYKDVQIKFSHSISMGIYGQALNKSIDQKMLNEVTNEMKRLVDLNLPIERKIYSVEEIKEYYEKMGYEDKIRTLKYRKENVNVYECNGYINYMYSYMVPSTGYLKDYNLLFYYPGFIAQFPRIETNGQIPEFVDSPVFIRNLHKAASWADLTNSDMVYKLNNIVEENNIVQFVNMCETRHNHQLKELGDKIIEDIDTIKLIAIAGPSSSGKTTFSKRLEIELLTRGIKPLMISIDNYYLPAEKAPLDEFGKPDFEHIKALDLELFNQNMIDLINRKEVDLPFFDFELRERKIRKKVKLDNNTIIIIEGIHALNDELTKYIPKEQKFKIYISPLPQKNIDNHNPINLTDLRMLRRIVRDKRFRNTPPIKTLEMWPSVRRGEHKWIYPYMEGANYIFNSELSYELLVMKKYAIDALKAIESDSEYYIAANRLLKFLKYFRSIDDDIIPCNSILREFIGGSVFKE